MNPTLLVICMIAFCGVCVWIAHQGIKIGWHAQKFIDIQVRRRKLRDLVEVTVGDRKYEVACIEQVPLGDRKLVLKHTLAKLNWNLHFLRKDPNDLVRECATCKEEWYPHQDATHIVCKKTGEYHPRGNDAVVDTDSIKKRAIEAHANQAIKEYREFKAAAKVGGHLRLVPPPPPPSPGPGKDVLK